MILHVVCGSEGLNALEVCRVSLDIDSRQQAVIALSVSESLESVAAEWTSCACYGLSVAYSALCSV